MTAGTDVEHRTLTVDGAPISVWAMGSGQPVVLVHGGGASSQWWTWVARLWAPTRRVIAVDLSGHGLRERYPVTTFGDEIAAAIAEVADGPAIVVAHSFGGRAGVMCAVRYPWLVKALILLDSILPTRDGEPQPPTTNHPGFPLREDAIRRFRMRPGGDTIDPGRSADLAERFVIERNGNWTFAYDATVFHMDGRELVNPALPKLTVPVGVVQGERSSVATPLMVDELAAAMGRPVPYEVVPGCDHHPMVEDPDATLATLERMIGRLVGG
jgi:pimeloyl-ACP methyl ester carboxylesterase